MPSAIRDTKLPAPTSKPSAEGQGSPLLEARSFRGLVPGQSTRVDVERVLGEPLGKDAGVSPRSDYDPATPGKDLARLSVSHYSTAPIVEAIEVEFSKKHSDDEYRAWFKLPQASSAGVVNGKFVEVHVPQGISLTHSGPEASSPVASFRLFDGSLPPEAQGGFFGVTIAGLATATPQQRAQWGTTETQGFLVQLTDEGGPGRRAGLLPGDVILAINGEQPGDLAGLQQVMARNLPGSKVVLSVLRSGSTQEVPVELGAFPATKALFLRADRSSAGGQYDLAMADLDKALLLDPNSAEAYARRGWARLTHGWAPADDASRTKALSDLSEAIRLAPNLATAYIGRVSATFLSPDADQPDTRTRMLADLTIAIQLQPADPVGYFLRGQVYRHAGDLEKALADETQAVTLAPANPLAWVERGHVWFAAAQYAKAVDDYTQALQLNPNNATAHLWRGRSWANLGNSAAAFADFTKAVQLDPNGPAGQEARRLLQSQTPAAGNLENFFR
jgi:tetratricopeptide (TPR) repeat protein